MTDDYGEYVDNYYAPDYEKDPDSTTDYSVNWGPSLDGDELLTSVWTLPDGMTQVSATYEDGVSTIVVSGGSCGRIYRLENRVTTTGGRTLDKTIRIKITEQ